MTYDDCIIIIVNPRRPLFTASEAHERYSQNLYRKERDAIMRSIESRLRQLEAKHLSDAMSIMRWATDLIARGAYYDELTSEEKEKYEEYKESLGGVADDVAGARLELLFAELREDGRDPYHFKLTPRKRPPTPEEHEQHVKEVQEIFERIKQEKANDAGKE